MSLIFPSHIKPSVSDFRLLANSKTFASSFNRSQQTVAWAGEIWTAKLSFRALNKAQASDLIGFLWSLKGASTAFYMGDSAFTQPMGTGNGAVVVNGGGQTGTSINVRGGAAGEIILKAGDYLQIGNELKGVTKDCLVAGDTTATIEFEPRLRAIPSDTSVVILKNTQGLFRLKDDQQLPRRSTTRRVLTDISLQLTEAV